MDSETTGAPTPQLGPLGARISHPFAYKTVGAGEDLEHHLIASHAPDRVVCASRSVAAEVRQLARRADNAALVVVAGTVFVPSYETREPATGEPWSDDPTVLVEDPKIVASYKKQEAFEAWLRSLCQASSDAGRVKTTIRTARPHRWIDDIIDWDGLRETIASGMLHELERFSQVEPVEEPLLVLVDRVRSGDRHAALWLEREAFGQRLLMTYRFARAASNDGRAALLKVWARAAKEEIEASQRPS